MNSQRPHERTLGKSQSGSSSRSWNAEQHGNTTQLGSLRQSRQDNSLLTYPASGTSPNGTALSPAEFSRRNVDDFAFASSTGSGRPTTMSLSSRRFVLERKIREFRAVVSTEQGQSSPYNHGHPLSRLAERSERTSWATWKAQGTARWRGKS